MGYLKKIKELMAQQEQSPVPESVKEDVPEKKNAMSFKSCDDYTHPDNCDCGVCSILGKKSKEDGIQRHIRKTTSQGGETVYYVTEYKKGGTVFYLVYPSEDEYEAIEREYEDTL